MRNCAIIHPLHLELETALFIGQIQLHRADLGFVYDLTGGQFYRDREADLLRECRCFLCAGCHCSLDQRQFYRCEKGLGLFCREPAWSALRQGLGANGLGRRKIDIFVARHLADRLPSPGFIGQSPADDAGRNLGVPVGRNGFSVNRERSLQVSFCHPAEIDRFVPSRCLSCGADSLGDSCCDRTIVCRSDRYMQDDEGIDLVCFQHYFDGSCMLLFCGKADHINGISERRCGREKGCEGGLCLFGQFRHGEPLYCATIGAEHAGAAGIGQDADLVTARNRLGR